MIYLLALSVLLNVGLVAAFLHYLNRRDGREQVERALLLNRIQAPETAVLNSLPDDEEEDEMSDEDRELEEMRQLFEANGDDSS